MEYKYADEIEINDNLKASLDWLKECSENDYIFETGYSKELYDYIIRLQTEIKNLDEYIDGLWDSY